MMKVNNATNVNILKIRAGIGQNESISVPKEEPLQLKLNDEEFVTLLATPVDVKELFVGFLFTEGIIKGWGDILCLDECEKGVSIDIAAIPQTQTGMSVVQVRSMDVEAEAISDASSLQPSPSACNSQPSPSAFSLQPATITSGCGRGITFQRVIDTRITTSIQFHCELISRLMKEFLSCSLTSGLHAAALADGNGRILSLKEDIGRHNAIDKVLGEGLIKGMDFGDKLLLSTGRISSEMAQKAARAGIPVVVARSCPTSLAVKWAETWGITIVGQVRGGSATGREGHPDTGSMSVYGCQGRICYGQHSAK